MNAIVGYCIKFRALVALATTAIAAGGVWAYMNLPIEAFPDVLNQVVQVITQAPGQSAQDVERMVTVPLEREFTGIPRLIQMRSVSEFGLSVIYLYFDDEVDGYWARTQTNEKIMVAELPEGMQPQLAPMASVTGEILRYEVSGPAFSSMELRTLQDWTLEKQFRSVAGVADVVGYGGLHKIVEVAVDPLKIATFGLPISTIASVVGASGKNAGGHLMDWPNQSFVVRSDGELKSLGDLENVGVLSRGSSFIHLKDLAKVSISNAPVRGVVGRDDRDSIVQGIVLLRKGDNPILTGRRVNERLANLNTSGLLPPGVTLKKYYDRMELVAKTTLTVGRNLLEGVLLVCILLFLFLKNLRATVVVASIVPLSMAFAFLMMIWKGTPANMVSLGSIDFGIIIDGALIIVEYALVRYSLTRDRSDVAVSASVTEIVPSVMFSMAMIILAYLPIFTLQRVEGKMFGPLAWTICFALLGALIVSVTFVPSLLPWVLKGTDPDHEHEPPWVTKIKEPYLRLLERVLERPFRAVAAAAVLGVLGFTVFYFSGSEFLPELDEGALWIRATLPHSTSLNRGTELARKIRQALKKNPEVRTVVSQLGGPEDGTDPNLFDNCEFFVDLKPKESWTRFGHSHEKFVAHIRRQLGDFPGIGFNVSQPIADNVAEAVTGLKGKNAIKLFGPDLDVLEELTEKISKVLRSVKGVVDVGPVAQMPMSPQVTIRVDRAKVAQLGMSLQDINDLVEIAVGGKKEAFIFEGEKRFDVIVRAESRYRSSLEDIRRLPIPLPGGKFTTLDRIADISLKEGPLVIHREQGFRRTGVKYDIQGRDLGSATKEILAKLESVEMPQGYMRTLNGEFENQKRAMTRLSLVIPLTIFGLAVLLFMLFMRLGVVGAILVHLHLSITGSIFLLFLRGIPISVPAAVGLLVLFGLGTLDSVALSSTLLKNLKEMTGVPLKEAVMATLSRRFRPILMTSALAGFGLLPAALSHGIGAETQKPLATAVIGGIFTGLPLVLFVLPALLLLTASRLDRKETY